MVSLHFVILAQIRIHNLLQISTEEFTILASCTNNKHRTGDILALLHRETTSIVYSFLTI